MTDISTLGIKLDSTAVDAVTAAFDRLTASIERASEALKPVAAKPASGGVVSGKRLGLVGESAPETTIPKRIGRRVSTIKGDPGEPLYAQSCGDGKKVKVYLDGVEQKWVETADETEDFVDRVVETPGGNMAVNHANNEILKERVYGDVRIVVDGDGASRLRIAPNGRRFTPFPA